MSQGFEFDISVQRFPTKLTGRNFFHPKNLFDGRLSENRITTEGYKIFPVIAN